MSLVMWSRVRQALLLLLVMSVIAAGCGADDSEGESSGTSQNAPVTTTSSVDPAQGVTISGAWTRTPVAGQTTAAVYGVISNGTAEPVTVVSVSTPVTDQAALHQTTTGRDGAMQMRAVDDGLEIAPGDSLTLEPGGTHIMLSGVDPANYPAAVEVTLTFDGAGPITFQAPSQAGAPDPMAGMDHSGM